MQMNARLLRRFLVLALIRYRKRAGLTQAAAAAIAGCGQSRISNLESGRNLPRIADLRLLLPAYGVDGVTIKQLEELPKLIKQRKGWYDRLPEHVLPEWLADLVAFEEGAISISVFELAVVAGLLQLPAYARCLISEADPDLKPEEVDRRVNVRMSRQQSVFSSPEQPRLWFILTEAALRLEVGTPDIRRAQLQHLQVVARRPRVELQVLPASAGGHPGLHGTFHMLQLPIEDDPGLVYIEPRARGQFLDDAESLADYSHVLNRLRVQALNQEDSLTMISNLVKEIG